MKKILSFFIFLALCVVGVNVSAYSTGEGTVINPIQVEITQDPFQQMVEKQQQEMQLQQILQQQQTLQSQQQQQSLESSLKSQYGVSAYYACSSTFPSCTTGDMSDPSRQSSCLIFIKSCLESKSMQKSDTEIQKTQNWDQRQQSLGCMNKYGLHSFYDAAISMCSCQSGYTSNGITCIAISVPPTKSNDQICRDYYSQNSIWTGNVNDAGQIVCGCKAGYVWNDQQTDKCVFIPVVPVKSNDQKVIPTSPSPIPNKKGLESPTKINSATTEISISETIASTTQPIQPIIKKSIWSRLFSWFGFNF